MTTYDKLPVQEVSVIIATHGSPDWRDAAWSVPFPTARQACRTDWGLDEVIVRHYPDATLAEARNEAATLATKQWLCFLDADDQLATDYVEKMAAAMRRASSVWRPSMAIHGCWVERTPMELLAPAVSYIHPNGTKTPPAIPNSGRWPDLNECVIGTLIPRFAFELLCGFRDLASLEDYDLWLRAVKAGLKITHVEPAVYYAAVHPAGDGRNADQSIYPKLRREHAVVWEEATVV